MKIQMKLISLIYILTVIKVFAGIEEDIAILSDSKIPMPRQILDIENRLYSYKKDTSIPEKQVIDLQKRLDFFRNYCLPFRMFDPEKPIWSFGSEETRLFILFSEMGENRYADYELWTNLKWLHGTNSSVLACLPYLNYELLPTGKLLQKGVAPMSGELTRGGMVINGVSYYSISGCTIRTISRPLSYADRISHEDTNIDEYLREDYESLFEKALQSLLVINYQDLYLKSIPLLRLKQWDYEKWKICVRKNQIKVDEIIKSKEESDAPWDTIQILRALDFDKERLESIWNLADRGDLSEWNKFCATQLGTMLDFKFQQGYCYIAAVYIDHNFSYCRSSAFALVELLQDILRYRLLPEEKLNRITRCGDDSEKSITDVFYRIRKETMEFQQRSMKFKTALDLRKLFYEDPIVRLSKEDKELVLAHFPIVFGSTKVTPIGNPYDECWINKGQIGQEIDIIWVEEDHKEAVQSWLDRQEGLNLQIRNLEELREMSKYSIGEHSSQIISNIRINLSCMNDLNFLFKDIFGKLVLFENGAERTIHGIAHAARSSVIATLLWGIYKNQRVYTTIPAGVLETIVACHDLARDQDGGDDHHLEGKCEEMSREILEKSCFKKYASLSQIIVQKESKDPSISVETKILHDADCLELVRVLSPLDEFRYDWLWIVKDFGMEYRDVIIEIQKLIKITEHSEVKNFIEKSESPYQSVYTIFSYLSKKNRYSEVGNFLSIIDERLKIELPQEIVKILDASY